MQDMKCWQSVDKPNQNPTLAIPRNWLSMNVARQDKGLRGV